MAPKPKRGDRTRLTIAKGAVPITRVNHSEYLHGRDPYVEPRREAGEPGPEFAERTRRFNEMLGLDTDEFISVDFTPADDDDKGMAD